MRPTTSLLRITTIPQKYNLINSIPKPTITPISCQCTYPESHPINHYKPLLNTKSPTYKHVLIPTSVPATEWPSKVELVPDSLISEFARLKRDVLDPMNPVMVSNIHLNDPMDDVLVFPDNEWFSVSDVTDVPKFMNEKLRPDGVGSAGLKNQNQLVLICGHAQRDVRCGLIAPELKKEFEHVLRHEGLLYDEEKNPNGVKVGIISHVGGHAYAGNVIYFDNDGLSIWYGRVEVDHVDPIVKETILGSNILQELYRGRY